MKCVRSHIWGRVYDLVPASVWRGVVDRVYGRVWDRVWNCVWNRVWWRVKRHVIVDPGKR